MIKNILFYLNKLNNIIDYLNKSKQSFNLTLIYSQNQGYCQTQSPLPIYTPSFISNSQSQQYKLSIGSPIITPPLSDDIFLSINQITNSYRTLVLKGYLIEPLFSINIITIHYFTTFRILLSKYQQPQITHATNHSYPSLNHLKPVLSQSQKYKTSVTRWNTYFRICFISLQQNYNIRRNLNEPFNQQQSIFNHNFSQKDHFIYIIFFSIINYQLTQKYDLIFPYYLFSQNQMKKGDSELEKIGHIETFLNRTIQSSCNFSVSQQTLTKLTQNCKHLIDIIEILKLQRRSYVTILQNNKTIQQKLSNHNNIVQSIQNTYNERIKVMAQETKILKEQLQKQKKHYQDKYQNIDKEIEDAKDENQKLKKKIAQLNQKIVFLNKINSESTSQISENKRIIQTLTKLNSHQEMGDPDKSTLQSLFTSKINPVIIRYLSPKDIKQLFLTNRKIRQSILNTHHSIHEIFRSINKTNRTRTRFLQRHIRYFDQSCEKISEDIIQSAFYKYMILKKNIGAYMISILTDCALLFEGKFVENLEELPPTDQSLQELQKYEDFPVDNQIKEMYKQELAMQNQMISDEVYTLYQKIHNTAQLYSADVESIGLFLNNLQNNYSKLFVFSKKMCTQSKHLQMLNTYLIKLLMDRHHFELTKNSEIQDLKAQLESESKIKNFFSNKSINSDQRCLSLENQKLNFQMKLKDLSQRYHDLQQTKKKNQQENKDLDKKNQILIKDNKLFKQNFDQVHNKYTKIMQQLEILRNNLQKMNLSTT